jgi:hypothetical protein
MPFRWTTRYELLLSSARASRGAASRADGVPGRDLDGTFSDRLRGLRDAAGASAPPHRRRLVELLPGNARAVLEGSRPRRPLLASGPGPSICPNDYLAGADLVVVGGHASRDPSSSARRAE